MRVGREHEQIAQTSLALMTKLQEKVCKVRIVHVGGTLEKVEKALKKLTECWLEAQAWKQEQQT